LFTQYDRQIQESVDCLIEIAVLGVGVVWGWYVDFCGGCCGVFEGFGVDGEDEDG
jgi:hypothetical protein